ncbi:hypothetical protein AgCh_007510 [Apium graveolens]
MFTEPFRDDDLFWQSASSGKKKTIYVFTKLSKNGKRVSRRAGRGTWVGQSNKKIEDKKSNEVLGSRGAFTYKIDKKVSSNGESDDKWCMYEYTLDDKFSKKLGLPESVQDYAICEIIKRGDDNASEYSVNLLESSNQYDTDSSVLMGEVNQILTDSQRVPNIIDTYSPMHVGEVNQIVPVAQGVPNTDHEPWFDADFSMPMGEFNQILPVAEGVPNIDDESWIDDIDFTMPMGEFDQILPVAEGVPYLDHEPRIDTYSSMPGGEVNQILPVAQGVPNIDHGPWIDTDFSMPMGEFNQILPVDQQGVLPNIDHEPWIVDDSNYSQAANPQHVINQNNPNIPMLPGETDQPILVAEGVIHNVPAPDYQPETVIGNNQSSATIPLMDEEGDKVWTSCTTILVEVFVDGGCDKQDVFCNFSSHHQTPKRMESAAVDKVKLGY